VSQYRISIEDAGSTSIAWGTNTLNITIDGASPDQIQDIIDEIPGATGTPWANLSDISAPDQRNAPIISNTDFEDLYNYINAQTGIGRYYPDAGKVWKWYDGYPSSGESVGDERYGEWVESKSRFKYVIEVDGDLTYLGSEAFSVYLTTGKSYNVESGIIDVPHLTSGIEIEGSYFTKDVDYIFNSGVIEFFTDIFVYKEIADNSILYCRKTPIIEQYLFEQYGGMVGVSDWAQFNYRNISGKAGINTLLSSLRNPSTLDAYEKALNVYYGLPISPEKSRVVGLFESYGYKITDVLDSTITVELKPGEELHPFVQNQCIMVSGSGKTYVITGVFSNRQLGKFNVEDPEGLEYGDKLCVRLGNRFELKNVVHTGPYIDVYVREGYKPIKHVIDTVHDMYGTWPEIIIHGTDNFETNYDGLYHAVDAYYPAGEDANIVRIELYSHSAGTEPLYNDYLGSTTLDIGAGYAHISWPTHKFLYLYMLDSKKLYRAYMDAPMDTIYESGDSLDQYQVICRNAAVMNQSIFREWCQYRNFRKSPEINTNSDIIEMIFADSSAKFGQYFPSGLYRD
jgi:hypothetical protein